MSITTQARLMDGVSDAALSVLTQHHIPYSVARKICRAIVNQLIFVWEGNLIYITKTPNHEIMQRNQCIFDEFKGDNHDVLAEKYGVSIQWIYRIVKEMREDYIHRYQPDMFTPYEPDSEDISNFIREQFKTLGEIMDNAAYCIRRQLPKIPEDQALQMGKEIAYLTSELLKGLSAAIKKESKQPDKTQADLFGENEFKAD
ncbi:hypothetical protein CYG68_03550 [Morganella morganii]|uniref:Mor transcription activator domain-containing protein n=1 Tax=Morganella morganii TaxID=582 RepID=A0A8I0PY85_MORMO|nr:hypothetical protein [Morganella morganii]